MPKHKKRDIGERDSSGLNIPQMLALTVLIGLFIAALAVGFPAPVSPRGATLPLSSPHKDADSNRTDIVDFPNAQFTPRTAVSSPHAQVAKVASGRFEVCTKRKANCVIDGDTFIFDGSKVRIADIDAPEIGGAQCDLEYRLGMRAKFRLVDMLNVGHFELRPLAGRNRDRYGRELRVLTRNGRSIGGELIKEGLARKWVGKREPWCP